MNTLVGGALAVLLVLSASPANAFNPKGVDEDVSVVQEPAPAPQETPAEEPSADPATPTVPEDPAVETPTEEVEPGLDPDASEEAKPDEEAELDPVLEPTETAPEGELTEAPEVLAITGIVAVVPHESKITLDVQAAEEGNAVEEDQAPTTESGGGTYIATDEGPLVPIDSEKLGENPSTGQTFTGTLDLSDTARAAIDAEIGATDGALSQAEALVIAGDVAEAESQELAISGAVDSLPPVAGGVSTAAHKADIAYVTGGAAPGVTALKNLVTGSSNYWKTQTAGKVSAITPNATVKSFSSNAARCNINGLWTQAARQFGKTPQHYLSGSRHLVVFINAGGNCSGSGFGTLGTLHRGGLIWVDLQAIGNVSQSLATTAHEFGHNFGLGHGQVRHCTGATTDAATQKRWNSEYSYFRSVPKSPCTDIEYGDVSNIMGAGSALSGTKPTALSVVQKHQLGVLASGSLKTVTASGGRSQTFTIAPASSNSGLRGLKVNTPGGGSYFVEYRSGTGQDSGLPWANGSVMSFNSGGLLPSNYRLTTGVQITKNYPGSLSSGAGGGRDLRETLVTGYQATGSYPGKYIAMKAGKSAIPWNSTARVTVVSMTGSGAKVRVDFTPFLDVPYAHKFAKEINWMSSSGLSTGVNAGNGLRKYVPKDGVSREAMAAFLYRLEGAKYKGPAKSPFADVKKGDKFYNEIAWMYQTGLSTGIKQRSGKPIYSPKAKVSREAMAAFIYRLEKATYKGAKTSPFADVKKGQKFYKEITWMYSSGLSTGVKQSSGKPKYQPKNSVSREAMAAFLYRLKH